MLPQSASTFLRRPPSLRFLVVLHFLGVPALAQSPPPRPWESPPNFARMPHYQATDSRDSAFDSFEFFDGNRCVVIDGQMVRRTYALQEGVPASSDQDIIRFYATALETMGGTVLFDGDCPEATCTRGCAQRLWVGKARRSGKEMWVEVAPAGEGSKYTLTLVTREVMSDGASSASLLTALRRDGHVALYVQFGSDPTSIRVDSQPLLDQVAQMLTTHADLQLSVEGHTDDVGTPAAALALSLRQATAVREALLARGVDASRLTAVGWGQERPVAENRTEAGRAKNRRIELVEK